MQYEDATEKDKRAMDATHKLHSIGYMLQHIDVEQMQNSKPILVDELLYSIAEAGEMICEFANEVGSYLCDLKPAR